MGEPQKQKHWTFYVDMDGVVADLMSSIIEVVYSKDAVTPVLRGWPKGVYDMAEAIGQSESKIWSAVRHEGTNFWRDLKRYAWANPFVNQLQELGDVLFLSSPSRDASSAAGKLQWITDNFSLMARDYVFTPKDHKWRLAGPTSILVDDSQDNIDDWNEHGGIGILFPRPWNDGKEVGDSVMANHVMEVIRNRLKTAAGEEKKTEEE